ncbi:MAG: iron-containing alcohol dehydrogenase [Planctomycetaceae bacterium]
MSESLLTLDFVAPSRIVFGWGRRREAGNLARTLGRRAFVVCGSRTLESNGNLGQLIHSLRESGVEPIRLATISHEPLVGDVDAAVARLREAHAGAGDLLLAIGGGSSIDLAKAAGALATNREGESVVDYLEGVGRGLKLVNPPLPVLAMPTTGGTGSEATKNAVISSHYPPFKKSLRSELMVPRIALVDPELAVSVPPHITAWTGMDAITQAIESGMCRRSTFYTQEIARRSLVLGGQSVVMAYQNGSSQWAREAMAEAALLSGIALANSGLGMAHGVAAALGVHCQVPHGLACAVMLPVAVRVNIEVPEAQQRLYGLSFGFANQELMERLLPEGRSEFVIDEMIRAAQEKIDSLLERLHIPRRLSEIGVRREQIPDIVRDSRGNSMSGNPRELSDDELTRILEDML